MPAVGTVAGYMVIVALSAKIVALYATHHPPREELIQVQGIVMHVKLGGGGQGYVSQH